MLAGGKNSRLYKRLVYDLQIAQDVTAFQASAALDSQFQIIVTARPRPRTRRRAQIDRIRRSSTRRSRSCSRRRPPRASSQRAINQIEASFYDRMERVGGFGGNGDQLNAYYTATGEPGLLQRGPVALSRAVAVPTSRRRPRFWLPLEPARRADRGAGEATARTRQSTQ